MAEAIVFPDAEQVVIDRLGDRLPDHGYTGIAVGTKVPNPRPTRFVRILRTGGSRPHLVADRAQITAESWADVESVAAVLAQYVRAEINALHGESVDGVTVYGVEELSGLANLPDPVTSATRYTQTFLIDLRGAAAA